MPAMISQRELRRAVRHSEHELRDDVLQAYVAPRIWALLPVILVFVFVSSVCSIDVMFKAGRFMPGIFALVVGAAFWAGGLLGQIYVFAIWLEGRAAQRDREERGIRIDIPAGFLPYLKYSRALVPWIL